MKTKLEEILKRMDVIKNTIMEVDNWPEKRKIKHDSLKFERKLQGAKIKGIQPTYNRNTPPQKKSGNN